MPSSIMRKTPGCSPLRSRGRGCGGAAPASGSHPPDGRVGTQSNTFLVDSAFTACIDWDLVYQDMHAVIELSTWKVVD